MTSPSIIGQRRVCEKCGADFIQRVASRNRVQRFCSQRCCNRSRGVPKLGRMCSVESCERPVAGRGYCAAHYERWRKHGDARADVPVKPIARKGSLVLDGSYLVVRGQRVHRAVMEHELGRPLTSNETVHHINGDTLDNRIENLELWVTTHPSGQRVDDRVQDALDLLRLYAPHLLKEYP